MTKQNLYLGIQGEKAAVDFLKESGYRILARNYKTRLGEIDIVAYDKNTLAFVEVKTRHSPKFGLPAEAISRLKQKQISKAAIIFLKENKLLAQKARFDIVSVRYLTENYPEIDLIKNAFELDARYVI